MWGVHLRVSRKSDVKAPGKNLVRILQMWMVFVIVVLSLLFVTEVDLPSDVEWPWEGGEQSVADVPEKGFREPPYDIIHNTDVDLLTDTDGDGMPDGWESLWTATDPATHNRLLDPTDASDMYEDPDGDGYDYDHDGEVDACDDMIAPSRLDIAYSSDYEPVSFSGLVQGLDEYVNTTVVVKGLLLIDDGEFSPWTTVPIDRELELRVSDTPSTQTTRWVKVRLQPRCNRPVTLEQYSPEKYPDAVDRCRVDVQGLVVREAEDLVIIIRGHERFTNIMEYMAATYRGDNRLPLAQRNAALWNWTDPTDPDTDEDGMGDGWEVWYGRHHVEGTTGWLVWDVGIDPTYWGDAYVDLDGDLVETRYNFVKWLWVDLGASHGPEPPDGKSPNDPVTVGYNLHEFMVGTDPLVADTDGDSFPPLSGNTNDFDEVVFLPTDPTCADTDSDGMPDGWEVFFCLEPDDSVDGGRDEDGDGLVNRLEFVHETRPRDPDTDGDIMWDGWEVRYGLNPRDPIDAVQDSDRVGGNPAPDRLLNWQEFLNGTDPTDPDTDDDHLSDYEEVVQGFHVTVDGVVQHYFTDPTSADTDRDDWGWVSHGGSTLNDDEDGDGNSDPAEEVLDGKDNDGDAEWMQNNGIDDDHDGVIDDGRAGIPAVGMAEGVDEEVDFNDWNEVFVFQTNASNPDSDLDGLDDWTEWFMDRDAEEQGIQRTSPLLSDTDGDGLTDKEETAPLDGPPPGVPRPTHPLRPDSDFDGLTDWLELMFDQEPEDPDIDSTDPWDPDTDDDGLLDGDEFKWADHDHDGLPTWWERAMLASLPGAELSRDADGSLVADILEDQDGDGLTCLEEYMWRCNPFLWDTDGDGVPDGADVGSVPWHLRPVVRRPVCSDTDMDLMPDWWELLRGLDPDSPIDIYADPDRDGLVNRDEYIYDLDPFDPDTDDDGDGDLFDHEPMGDPDCYDSDGDGIGDWWERLHDSVLDPTNPYDWALDSDSDGVSNLDEWSHWGAFNRLPTDPTEPDSDHDGIGDEADPFPVPVLTNRRPLNPTRGVAALDPLRNVTLDGKRQGTQDMDQDGLTNGEELRGEIWRTDPADPDTDLDGMPDGWEELKAMWDPKTARPNMSPIDPNDALLDPDWDGVNYSLKRDPHGDFIISQGDCNRDGWPDPTLENETFCNLEEYLFGLDLDRDGINDLTPHPNRWDTDGDGVSDGFEALLGDHDGDLMDNWFELVYGLDPFGTEGETGPQGDLDGDGWTNLQELWNGTSPRESD